MGFYKHLENSQLQKSERKYYFYLLIRNKEKPFKVKVSIKLTLADTFKGGTLILLYF